MAAYGGVGASAAAGAVIVAKGEGWGWWPSGSSAAKLGVGVGVGALVLAGAGYWLGTRKVKVVRRLQSIGGGGGVVLVESDAAFARIVQSHLGLVVVEFFADWCEPSKDIASVFETLSLRYPGALFVKVNVELLPVTTTNAGVRAMPTFLFLLNGERVAEVHGADALKKTLERLYVPLAKARSAMGSPFSQNEGATNGKAGRVSIPDSVGRLLAKLDTLPSSDHEGSRKLLESLNDLGRGNVILVQDALAQHNGARIVVRWIDSEPLLTRLAAVRLLAQMLQSEANRNNCDPAEVVAAVSRQMEVETHFKMKMNLLICLMNLAMSVSGEEAVAAALPLLMDIFTGSRTEVDEVFLSALRVMVNMCHNPTCAVLVASSGGLPRLVQLLAMNSNTSSNSCLNVLSRLLHLFSQMLSPSVALPPSQYAALMCPQSAKTLVSLMYYPIEFCSFAEEDQKMFSRALSLTMIAISRSVLLFLILRNTNTLADLNLRQSTGADVAEAFVESLIDEGVVGALVSLLRGEGDPSFTEHEQLLWALHNLCQVAPDERLHEPMRANSEALARFSSHHNDEVAKHARDILAITMTTMESLD